MDFLFGFSLKKEMGRAFLRACVNSSTCLFSKLLDKLYREFIRFAFDEQSEIQFVVSV